jgi:hypothetical protein
MNSDCFGLDHKHKCTVLTIGACAGGDCPFFKTEESFKASLEAANRRLAGLDTVLQLEIADKYFDGRMPWLEGGAGHDR